MKCIIIFLYLIFVLYSNTHIFLFIKQVHCKEKRSLKTKNANTQIHFKMITTVSSPNNTSITSCSYQFVCIHVWGGRTCKIYSLTEFHVNNAISLTMIIRLCVTPPECIHLQLEVCTL